jgi:RHS repeat-associated protein
MTETHPEVDFLFGYTGKLFDKATGLQNNVNRWYDPGTGRWISEDPLGFAGGDPNLYRYVGNGPMTHADPLGLKTDDLPPKEIPDLIGGVTGGGASVEFVPKSRVGNTGKTILPKAEEWNGKDAFIIEREADLEDFLKKQVGRYDVRVVEIGSHGTTAGAIVLDKNIDASNCAALAAAFEGSKVGLIILSGCVVGNFTKGDVDNDKDYEAVSLPQALADATGISVVSAGGFVGGGALIRGEQTVDDTDYIRDGKHKGQKTLFQLNPDAKGKADPSQKNKHYITYPWWWTKKQIERWVATKGKYVPPLPTARQQKAHDDKIKARQEKAKQEAAARTSFSDNGSFGDIGCC